MSEQELEGVGPEEEIEAVEVETTQEAPKKEWSDDDEVEARAFGWKPPEEWQGRKPEGFIDDPRAYMDRAMTFKPFRTLKERFDSLERTADERIRKVETASLEFARKQFDAQLDAIRTQKAAAVEYADVARYKALDQQEAELAKQMPQAAPQRPAQPGPDPWVEDYRKTQDGAWINNAELRNVGARLINGNPDMLRASPQEQVQWAEREIRNLYPQYFSATTPRPAPRQVVDGGGLASSRAGDDFGKLPKDAREVFNRYVKEGVVKDTKEARQEWANEYNAA